MQATTQSMQPTHWRVSITMPKRAISGLLHERDEVAVQARAAHQRIGLVLRQQLRRARPGEMRAAHRLRRVPEPVHQVYGIGANPLRRLDLDTVAEGAVLVLERHERAVRKTELRRG